MTIGRRRLALGHRATPPRLFDRTVGHVPALPLRLLVETGDLAARLKLCLCYGIDFGQHGADETIVP